MNKRMNKNISFNIVILLIILLIIVLVEVNSFIKVSSNNIEYVYNNDMDSVFSSDIDLNIIRRDYNNDEIVGRLEIPGLFNLIITQGKDNDYYLNHNILKKYDIKGNEYLDYRNDVIDININIYGHNSELYNVPFKKLEYFLDRDYFYNSKYILFQVDNGRRIYEIVAFKKVDEDYEHMQLNNVNQKEHIDKLLNNSIYVKDLEYDNKTNIIVLQTCVMNNENSYYILVGFEVI